MTEQRLVAVAERNSWTLDDSNRDGGSVSVHISEGKRWLGTAFVNDGVITSYWFFGMAFNTPPGMTLEMFGQEIVDHYPIPRLDPSRHFGQCSEMAGQATSGEVVIVTDCSGLLIKVTGGTAQEGTRFD